MVMEIFNFFEKFQQFADGGGGGGGHDEKLKIFANRKKIIDLYELDNSKKKIFFEKKNFKVDSKCHFSSDFEQK